MRLRYMAPFVPTTYDEEWATCNDLLQVPTVAERQVKRTLWSLLGNVISYGAKCLCVSQ